MKALLTFWIESGLSMMLFYAVYHFLLRKEADLPFNRFYLLSGLLVSILIPLFHFGWALNESYTGLQPYMPEYWLSELPSGDTMQVTDTSAGNSLFRLLFAAYTGITGFLFVRLALQIRSLIVLVRQNVSHRAGSVNLIYTREPYSPFSVFNYIFLGRNVPGPDGLKGILRHELVHVRQFHSIDRFFVELLCILFWFNPFVYLYRRSITEVHEFIADRSTIGSGYGLESYQYLILGLATSLDGNGLVSRFSNSLTKKRLIMMNRINNKKRTPVRKLLLLPVLLAVVLCFGFDYQFSISVPVQEGNSAIRVSIAQEPPDMPSGMPFEEGADVKVTSGYGMRLHPIKKEKMMHYGIDLAAPLGTPVISTAGGKVEKAEFQEGYGNLVLVRHSQEYSTLYTQLQGYTVEPGQKVRKGEVIGYLGQSGTSTGPHLHYEVHKNGERVNPADYIK